MPDTVGSHSVAAFTSPSNGDALDANVVKGNDNSLRTAYVAHDADPGIHVQSSLLASRPAAGTVGRKWMTTDSGSVKMWYDTGSVWEELATNLTALNASNLTSGTVPDARFPATLPTVSGANLTNLNASNLASGTVPDARFPATLPAVSGANLTNLNASNISSGTLPSARLPTTITSSTTFSASGSAIVVSNNARIEFSGTGAIDTANVFNLSGGNAYISVSTAQSAPAITSCPALSLQETRYLRFLYGGTVCYIPFFI